MAGSTYNRGTAISTNKITTCKITALIVFICTVVGTIVAVLTWFNVQPDKPIKCECLDEVPKIADKGCSLIDQHNCKSCKKGYILLSENLNKLVCKSKPTAKSNQGTKITSTTTTKSPVSSTTGNLMTEILKSQRIFYTRKIPASSYGDIYDYVIDDVHGPQLKGKYKMPYRAKLPSLTFNYDLKMLRIL